MGYESLLLLGVLSATFLVPHLLIGVFFQAQAPGAVLLAHLFVVLLVYFLWFWTHGGQTLAMQTWRIRLVDARDNQPLGIRRAVLRFILSWPCLLFAGAGLIWALFDPERQFLHDRLASTRLMMAEDKRS